MGEHEDTGRPTVFLNGALPGRALAVVDAEVDETRLTLADKGARVCLLETALREP